MPKSNLMQSLIALAVKIGAGFLGYILFIVIARIAGATEFGVLQVCWVALASRFFW